MVDTAWLIEKLGPPYDQNETKFHVEYITTGKKYVGTNVMAFTDSEVVERVIRDAGCNTVGRILFSPITLNETCSFQLMNSERLT
jgi:hypothetical protein